MNKKFGKHCSKQLHSLSLMCVHVHIHAHTHTHKEVCSM